jgi:hypothetical protein
MSKDERADDSAALPVMGVTLLLALTACGPGSKHESPVSELALYSANMQITELELLLWPKRSEHWRPPSEQQQAALDDLVTVMLGHARRGRMSKRQRRHVTKLAIVAGLELHTIALEHDGEVEHLWVLIEPLEDRRGLGSYLFRLGAIEPKEPNTEYLIQAPHSRHDKHTGNIALSMFAEADGRPARALFVNSVHRYAQADGTRGKREPARANPADPAHREDHPFSRATARVLQAHDLALVQLHGFERDEQANDPEIIVSSGRVQPTTADSGTLVRLRAAFPELVVAQFGVDTDRLGATTNVQGQAARTSHRCFVHIEAGEAVRETLRSDRDARRRFAAALFGGSAGELRGGCR